MATPTTYNLSYDTPCDVEAGCGDVPCGGKPEFNPRPQVFCREVDMLSSLTISGRTQIRPPEIFVGGLKFIPATIIGLNGTFTVLAAA